MTNNQGVQPKAASVEWEYKVEASSDFDELESELDGYGAEGWELVSMIYAPGKFTPFVMVLKRHKDAPQ